MLSDSIGVTQTLHGCTIPTILSNPANCKGNSNINGSSVYVNNGRANTSDGTVVDQADNMTPSIKKRKTWPSLRAFPRDDGSTSHKHANHAKLAPKALARDEIPLSVMPLKPPTFEQGLQGQYDLMSYRTKYIHRRAVQELDIGDDPRRFGGQPVGLQEKEIALGGLVSSEHGKTDG